MAQKPQNMPKIRPKTTQKFWLGAPTPDTGIKRVGDSHANNITDSQHSPPLVGQTFMKGL
jgi:hypothetical protein